MQELGLRDWKLNLVNSISTLVIAFISFVGLILAFTEFLQTKKFLNVEKTIFIIILMAIILSSIIYKTKRWIEHA